MTSSDIAKEVRRLTTLLSELGDVQVLLSYVSPEGETMDVVDGIGNWHARLDLVREFLDRAECCDTVEMDAEDDDDYAGKGAAL